MFNRREFFVGAFLVAVTKPSNARAQDAGGLPEGFVYCGDAPPLTDDQIRYLRWERAEVITLFSPDKTRVFTARRTDDFAQIWDEATREELRILLPFKVERGDWVSYSDDGEEILVTAKDGAVLHYDGETGSSPI